VIPMYLIGWKGINATRIPDFFFSSFHTGILVSFLFVLNHFTEIS